MKIIHSFHFSGSTTLATAIFKNSSACRNLISPLHFQDDESGQSCIPNNIKKLQGVPGAPYVATQCHSMLLPKAYAIIVSIPYTAKLSRGKTFAVVHKTHHSLENFRGASGPCHYILYTANDSRGKLSRMAKKQRKPRKFSPSKVLPYTVY